MIDADSLLAAEALCGKFVEFTANRDTPTPMVIEGYVTRWAVEENDLLVEVTGFGRVPWNEVSVVEESKSEEVKSGLDDGFVAPGKVWVSIHGLYQDDLIELDASTPEKEIAEARKVFRDRYPGKAVFISTTRITHEESTKKAEDIHAATS